MSTRDVTLYFVYSSLQYDAPKTVHDKIQAMLTQGALTPNRLFEDAEVNEIRVVSNNPFEAEAHVTLTNHEGFVNQAISAAEREDKYREAMYKQCQPTIVGLEFE